MQTKIIEILSSATGWMTAAEIADKGKWRSAANVGLTLKQMTDAECRTSQTKKAGNGMPAKEYKLADKSFDGDEVAAKPATKKSLPVENRKAAAPVVKDSLTTETNLHQQIAHLTDALAGLKSQFEAVAIERNVAESALMKNNNLFHAAISDLARINEVLELDPEDGGAEPIISAIKEISATLREESAEVARLKAENHALKILNESMPGFGAAHAGISKGPFVVRIPGKPAVFSNKYDNAKAAAMSAARQKRSGEVFALIPVGKAVRGAEWVQK